jgi:undecaprenyl diphosphate synthase
MFLFRQYLESEIELLVKHGIRLRVIGRRDTLPSSVRRLVENVENATEHLSSMELLLAISYGGRDEIVDAVREIGRRVVSGEIDPENINAEVVASHLYAPDVPDPDLLIRTSDEFRISNFLLWQLAYSELIVSPFRWPDFSREEFHRCLNDFSRRERRFGQTSDQLKAIGYG